MDEPEGETKEKEMKEKKVAQFVDDQRIKKEKFRIGRPSAAIRAMFAQLVHVAGLPQCSGKAGIRQDSTARIDGAV